VRFSNLQATKLRACSLIARFISEPRENAARQPNYLLVLQAAATRLLSLGM